MKYLLLLALSLPAVGFAQCDSILEPDEAFKNSDEYWFQKTNGEFFRRVQQFSSRSWACPPFADLGSPKHAYVLSADIAPHFFVGGERLPFVLAFTPRYKVRIFRDKYAEGDSSLPVRTPSFMPGVTGYIRLNHKHLSIYDDLSYLFISFFHHSNGQDGPTFLPSGKFNLYNGNFSTNYFEIGFTKNWHDSLTRDTCFTCENSLYRNQFNDQVLSVSLEQHIGTADEQKGTYSDTRLNVSATSIHTDNRRWAVLKKGTKRTYYQLGDCYLIERYRWVFNMSINLDKLQSPYGSLKHRINAELGYYLRVAAGNTAWFIMTGYNGNDPYNIYYSQNYAFIRTGLALGIFVHTNKLPS